MVVSVDYWLLLVIVVDGVAGCFGDGVCIYYDDSSK